MILALLVALAVDDAAIGVWKFQPDLSIYESGPAPKESLRTWEDLGDRVRFLHEGLNAAGKPFRTEFVAALDGTPAEVKGSAMYDSVTLRRVDRWNVEQTFRKADKVTVRAKRTISDAGKRMTIIATGEKADGKPFRNRLVYLRK